MKKIALLGICAVLFGLLAASASLAGGSKWQVNGPHYNLNIIGMEKHGTVGDSDGHTMFVKLDGKTKIVMTQSTGGSFQVTDRNGLDGSASFNIAPGHYNVYAIPHGKPGGKVDVTAYGNFTDAVDGSTLLPLGYVNIARSAGKPQSVNINELFYVDVTICTGLNATTGTCAEETTYTDYWVFDVPELLEYYWDYNNDGLRQLQVRFYQCTLDNTGTASDYCRWGDGTPIDSTKTVVSTA